VKPFDLGVYDLGLANLDTDDLNIWRISKPVAS
jgi:hypothetical protein